MRTSIFFLAIPILFFAACASSDHESAYLASADSVTFAHDPSSLTSPSRKIIKQVALKGRVNNITKAVSDIEAGIKSCGGLVAMSQLQNHHVRTEQLQYKADSVKEITIYNATASLQLRVPTVSLDTVMQVLPAVIDFMEYRNIKQDDRTLAYLSNALKNKLHQDAVLQSAKPDSGVGGEIAIDRRIENLQLLDNVNYTTISLELTQYDQVHTTILPDISYATSEPFSTRLAHNLAKGWTVLKEIVIGLSLLWPFVLMGIGGWWILKWRKGKRINLGEMS